jgi:hypothetical protein
MLFKTAMCVVSQVAMAKAASVVVLVVVRNTHTFLSRFILTMIILPRQARDNIEKTLKNDPFFAGR